MFIRTKKSPNYVKTSVQLVENIRSKGKVSQKVIRHFGSAINDDELNVLFKLAETYKNNLLNELKGPSLFPNDAIQERILKRLDSVQLSALDADTSTNSTQEHENIKSNPPLIVDLRCLEEEKRIHCGSFMVYETIFKMLRFDTIFGSSRKRTALVKMLKNIVIARIEKPVSKLATTVYLSELRGINYDVNSVYRMMDYFTPEVIEGVQNRSYEYIKTLFGEEINVFFYDCTTLYFESFIEDELKKNGFGKDGKFNQPQVVLGLLVTPQGMPVGYELYEGSKFEGHTLNEAIKRLKEKYKIKKFCFVADAALLNGDNIKNFENAKQPFIVGARIKNMSKLTTQSILDKSKYSALYKDSKNEEEIGVTYQDLTLDNGLRLIVTYSPKRAKKNKYDREKAIEKARKELVKGKSASAIVNNKGYKRYFKLEKDSKVVFNEAKLKADEQWDGLHGVITNLKTEEASPINVVAQYKGLWQIEETFRLSKHNLRMRPIYHWTPQRVEAHVAICFMSLVCLRVMDFHAHKIKPTLSIKQINFHLAQVQYSILIDKTTKKRYILPSKISKEAAQVFKLWNVKWFNTPFELK